MTESLPYVPGYITHTVEQQNIAQKEVRAMLVGKPVKIIRPRKINGHEHRTGEIADSILHLSGVSVGVKVHRVDGQPGFLADTWWIALKDLEIVNVL